MATREFRLPDLGEGLTEAEIVTWLVAEGEDVSLNQPLVEVETAKAIVQIPSPYAGVVEKLHGAVGDRIEVGKPLATFRVSDGAAEAPEATAPKAAAAGAPRRREVLVGYGPEEEGERPRRHRLGRGKQGTTADTAAEPTPEPQPATATSHALATPPVRKLARDMGVDIDSVTGSGPGGRVTREDVVAAAEAPAGATKTARVAAAPREPSEGEERIPVRAIRRSIAEKLTRSYHEIVHVAEWIQIDVTEMERLRAELQAAPEAAGAKLSPLPIVIKALTVALKRHPLVNSSWDDATGDIVVKHHYDIGVATDTGRGLLVPVIKAADRLNIFELAAEITRLATSARDGSIQPPDLIGSTITVTNVGSFGMEAGTPVINYPEAAILAVGAIVKRPWVVGDAILARSVATLSLSFDHRIIDGAEAGRFLRDLGDLLEKPSRLFGAL